MTGSGTATGKTELGQVVVELRSVNSRVLSVKVRMGPEAQGLEAAVESLARSRLGRGTVSVVIAVTEAEISPEPVVDVELAARVSSELQQLADRLGVTVELTDVLSFPGVIPARSRSAPRVSRELPKGLRDLTGRALDQLVADRQREGTAIVSAMREEIDRFTDAHSAVQARAPEVVAKYRERLLERVNEFLEGRARAMEAEGVIREVAVFADRADITEELQRLGAHVERARELLAGGGVIGRGLEFLVQEMLREVNTVGSKSPDVAITHRVVEMKSCVDRLKEQAANLE